MDSERLKINYVAMKPEAEASSASPRDDVAAAPAPAAPPSCGVACVRSPCLRRCADVRVFMTLFCVAFLVDAVADAYVIGCLTTIERRFQFASKYSGLLLSGSTIAQMLSVLAGSYLGRRRQPAFLAIGTLLSAAGRLLLATPHFVYGAGATAGGRDGNASEYEMCLAGREEEVEEAAETECTSANQVAYAVMVAGMVLSGAGSSCLFSLGTSYVDDNLVNPRAAPLYLSIIYMMRALGPAIGFPLAGMFSKIYVDLSDTDLTPKDPQWIGAWWLGLLILSGVTFACALPFALFPNHLKSNATARDKSNVAVEHIDCDLQEHEKGEEIAEMIYYHPREFLRAMRRLLTNGLYVCVVLGVCFQFYSIIGYFAFLPKYLESYFGTTTAVSNSVVGMIGCVTPSIGLLLGGCFMRRRRLRPRGSFMLAFVSIFIYIALLIPMMLLPCDDLTHAGHFSDAGSYELSQDCNTDCGCNVEKYAPVCASNGVTYFSPCQAGCSDVYTLGDAKNFTGCSCTPDGVATAGKCDSACTGAMVAYFILLGVGGLLVAPANVASFSLKIRVVEPKDKAMALGLGTFLLSGLTFIPAPPIVGNLIDKTCVLWQTTDCGEDGACWKYDNARFRYTLHGVPLVTLTIAAVFYFVGFLQCKGRYSLGESSSKDGAALPSADVGVEKHELSAELNGNERGARQS